MISQHVVDGECVGTGMDNEEMFVEWVWERESKEALAGLNYTMILNLLRIEKTIRCAFIQFRQN